MREGTDISVITYGLQVYDAKKAADILAKDGISLEIIDLRTLYPLDKDMIRSSIAKTTTLSLSPKKPSAAATAERSANHSRGNVRRA